MKNTIIIFVKTIISLLFLPFFWLLIIYLLFNCLYKILIIRIDNLYVYKIHGFGRLGKIFQTKKRIVNHNKKQYLLKKEENSFNNYLYTNIIFNRQGIYIYMENYNLFESTSLFVTNLFVGALKSIQNSYSLFSKQFKLSQIVNNFIITSFISFFSVGQKNISIVCQSFDRTPPLLILWQDISSFKVLDYEDGKQYYQFFITRLKSASILLLSEDIEELEKNSGLRIDTLLNH